MSKDAQNDFFTNLFGSRHDQEVKKLQTIVDEIDATADRLQSLSEEEFQDQTEKFRGIIAEWMGPLKAVSGRSVRPTLTRRTRRSASV